MSKHTAIISVILCALFCAAFAATAELSRPAQAATCQEDMPCFNWAKMGNHKRGVVLVDGTEKVVTPCGFNRLWAHGAIRHVLHVDGKSYPIMPKLHGDYFARTLTDCPWRNREHKPFPWHQSVGQWAVNHGY